MTKTQKVLLVIGSLSLLAFSCDPAPTQQPSGQTSAQSMVRVTQSVAGQKQNEALEFSAESPKTALDLLKNSYEVQTQDFGPGLGEFVQQIGDAKPGSNQFWAFYLNDQSSNVGAGSYTPKEGDKLEWKLETINGSGE